jgi:hypothetical protein
LQEEQQAASTQAAAHARSAKDSSSSADANFVMGIVMAQQLAVLRHKQRKSSELLLP